MITFVCWANDWVQHGARYRGGGDVLKKSDTSPTLGWSPSARFMPVNFVSAKKLWMCLATGSHECRRRLLWTCMVVVAVHHGDFPLL